MQAAATRAFTQMLLSDGNHIVHHFVELNVSRITLVDDAIRELTKYTQNDYKKPLKVIILLFI